MRLNKVFVPALLLLPFCIAATNFAVASSTVDFSNMGGTLSGTTAGMSLSGSMLVAVSGLNGNGGMITGDLGTVSFSTGPLVNGSLQMGGTFNDGTFTVASNTNGVNGIPSGVLFSGSFNGPVTWTMVTLSNGTHNYTLTGVVTGSMGGVSVSGVSVQLTINTGKNFFNGSAILSSGDTSLTNSVPEPSTLAFFGTGAVGLAAALRRKVRQQGQKQNNKKS